MTIDESLRRDLLVASAGTPASGEVEKTGSFDLDQLIVSSSKQVLLKKIEFHPAEQEISFCLQNLRSKYEPLNAQNNRQDPPKLQMTDQRGSMSNPEDVKSDGIPKPKIILFNPEKIRLEWQKCHRIGSGLINMGNTCFLNSTLQCLSYTPPLANYLLSHQHKEQCQMSGFCMLCELYNHLVRVSQHHGQAVRPMVIIHKLKHIAKHMHLGRQEDAHEFLRYVIEAMQRSSTFGYDKLDKFSKETSIVHQIFGGYYRSRVTCSHCQGISDTFDPFLDIGLDIKHVPSVNKALDRLIRPEILDGDNKYKCARCKRQVNAQKKFNIHRSSNVLTLCLKKFDFQRYGSGKLHKDISYPEVLNIRPYMSDVKGPPVIYNLYAVLTHQGASCNSGHYFCFVRAPNKMWYCMNDAHVSQASVNRVLNQDAYLLFYIRKPKDASQNLKHGPKESPKARLPGPFSPNSNKNMSNNHNGGISSKRPESQASMQVPKSSPRPSPSFKSSPKPSAISPILNGKKEKVNHLQPNPPKPSSFQVPPQAKPLPTKREKLSFSFSRNQGVAGTLKTLQKEHRMKSELNPETSRPEFGNSKGKRIGEKLKIQNLVKPRTENPWARPTQGLVPYAADDSSDSDSDENYDDVVKRLSQQASLSTGSSQPGTSTSAEPVQTEVKEDANKGSLANSTDLTAIQSHDSPLKLTITTNGNAQRIKSTSTWHVNHSDSLISPSIHSESSTGSISSNSTQEWNVIDRQKDGSGRKSRSEEMVNSSHKPGTFPFGDKKEKNGKDLSSRGEMKSPAMRQLTFGKDVKNGEKAKIMGKPPLFEVRNPVTSSENVNSVERNSAGEHQEQHLSSQKDDSKHAAVPEKSEKNSLREIAKSPKVSADASVREEVKEESDLSAPTKGNGLKLKDTHPENGTVEKSTSNHFTVKDFYRSKGDTSSSNPASELLKTSHKLPGIRERLSEKINSHRNKKKKHKRSSDEEEKKLLGNDDDDDINTKASNLEKFEWYVVSKDEEERLKRKRRKRKRKKREEEEELIYDINSEKRKDRHWEKSEKKLKHGTSDESDSERECVRVSKMSRTRDSKDSLNVENNIHHRRRTSVGSDSEKSHPHHHTKKRFDSGDSEKGIHISQRDSHDKPKKRKHRDRKEDKKPLMDEDSDGDSYPSPKKKQHYLNGDRENPRHSEKESGRHHSGEGEKPHHHKEKREVHEQSWDHHMKDGHKKSHHSKHSEHNVKSSASWDGKWSGSEDIVSHLTKSSLSGYGSLVQSWDGGKSAVDEDAAKDAEQRRRRDSYDEEFDQGKVKKVKKRYDDEDRNGKGFRSHHRNPFQYLQNQKNKGHTVFWNHRYKSGYHQFGHRKSQSWHRSHRR
ncbi:Ubiquitin carboxyl-terminal hydrolase 36 [Holothuria leucospilota]|uniref:Ubiquitin carboxyl-terminal hydrolase 36 n=1 Tax=Holothuria leucospilota TaxID=206669 RepID=A0A9Q1C4L4_HOLLE|nr:Ubiquitin carboxyl-terminal hydrolase 36 [Holothuria leucospilota]